LKSESLRCITTACRGLYEPLKGRAATASQPRRTHEMKFLILSPVAVGVPANQAGGS
jgi:hypothetical protein